MPTQRPLPHPRIFKDSKHLIFLNLSQRGEAKIVKVRDVGFIVPLTSLMGGGQDWVTRLFYFEDTLPAYALTS